MKKDELTSKIVPDEDRHFSRGKWRDKYACRPLKGDHEYELVKPAWTVTHSNLRALSIPEFYRREEEEYEAKRLKLQEKTYSKNYWNPKVMYYFKCRACGHPEYEFSDRPNKRIKIRV